ncbi:helix-turn-helix transcriptional regulator [Amphibacillus sp. Q70]|uniref:helix-turn-helix transcriptional regulator n=1 Tax=Amphibacillus sp. Q70 TaxID=3453416 RepID=UPI003F825643
MQESRLFRIVYYLLEKGQITAQELSEKLEVSVRTIYRDIDVMSSAGIPVYATQGRGGGISILDNFVLDKSLFSESEREKILMALQGMTATDGENSNELLIKLAALFQVKATNWIEVDFSSWIQNKPKQDLFDSIKMALFNQNIISFQYFNSNGKMIKRRVQPIKLIFKSKDWYLYGFCLLKDDYRFFKLTRIKALNILSETFSQDFIPLVIEKQVRSEKTIKTRLKFDKRIAFRVYDEFTDQVTEDEHGNLYVQTELPDNERLYSYILSFADCVEVIEPKSVRERLEKKLENIQKKYKT